METKNAMKKRAKMERAGFKVTTLFSGEYVAEKKPFRYYKAESINKLHKLIYGY